MPADVAWQPSLFDGGDPVPDATFARLHRIQLDDTSWVDYCPEWLAGSDGLFAELLDKADWQRRSRWMYDKRVPDPRLTAGMSTDTEADDVPPVLREVADLLSDRYGVAFDRIWMNLYRDGQDSVAWHGDKNRHVMTNPQVVTVSLGARRRFLLRRTGTTKIAHELDPGHGDLVVMGGACQHDWEHTVPKTAKRVDARISVTIRHSQPAPGERWLKPPTSSEPGHAW